MAATGRPIVCFVLINFLEKCGVGTLACSPPGTAGGGYSTFSGFLQRSYINLKIIIYGLTLRLYGMYCGYA
jgi:hypothetical protein